MINTIILDSQKIIHLVIETQMVSEPIHSAWSKEQDARGIVEILNRDNGSSAMMQTIFIDDPSKDCLGYEVLVSLNTGEQVSDESIGMDQKCLFYENDTTAYAYNFIFLRAAAEEGEIPRKIDGNWYVQHLELTWKEFLSDHKNKQFLEDCTVLGIAKTKEEALQIARIHRLEILEQLENIFSSMRS